MKFSWDGSKDKANRKKHNLSFREVSEVFDDPLHISIMDKRFDYFDERWITIGITKRGKIVVTGHLYCISDDGTEIIRIITARKATNKERGVYEKIRN